MIYIIHRKHVFDGGSMKSWNAVTAYSLVYRTGAKEMEWSKDFRLKKDAVDWCRERNIDWMTEKDWDKYWNDALFEAGNEGDIHFKAAQILNERLFHIDKECAEWKAGEFEGSVLGYRDGYGKGLKKGIMDGRFEMAKEIAASMFELGTPSETVQILFNGVLSKEDLSQIRQDLEAKRSMISSIQH